MTKLYGIIGNPVTHSFSPDYFSEKFKRLGLNYSYDRFHLNDISELSNVLNANPSLVGFNVTSPFKEAIIPYLTEISQEAKSIGAVNTVVRDGDSLIGYNTDIIGFDKTIASLGIGKKGCLVLGSGGASNAVKYVLSKRKMPFKQVSRSRQNGMISYKEIDKRLLDQFPVIINTTPLGMMNRINEKPALPYNHISGKSVLIDLVYKPRATAFLRAGLNRGARIKNGFQMLVEQAEASWKIWSHNHENM